MAGPVDIVLEIPGRWDEVPAVEGGSIEERPPEPGLRERYERFSDGGLGPADLAALDSHTRILVLRLAGGSTDAARAAVTAAATLLESGGAAVLVQAAEVVHSRQFWLDIADRWSEDALVHAFVRIRVTESTAASAGMQALGVRDATMTRLWGGVSAPAHGLKQFLIYCARSSPVIESGDLFDGGGYVYRIKADDTTRGPYGMWRLADPGPSPVPHLTDVVAVAAGGHALALRADGSVWMWGGQPVVRPGPATTPLPVPVPVEGLPGEAVAIAAGERHCLILLHDGTVMAFGQNDDGELGDGTTRASTTPVPVGELSDVAALSAGSGHSIALLRDGSVVTWGRRAQKTDHALRSPDALAPTTVPGIELPAVAVAAGSLNDLALLSDGSVQRWGWDPMVRFQLGAPAVAVAAGSHGAAALRDGSLAAWGPNWYGQLGDGTRTDRADPVRVTVPGRVVGLAAGHAHTVVALDDGRVVQWGYPFGERLEPDISDAVAVSAGMGTTLVLKRDATVVAWGQNLAGLGRLHTFTDFGYPPPLTPPARASLEGLARPSVRLRGRPGVEVALGGSKLGGRPDLPEGMPWPVVDGVPQAFVAQVDMAQVFRVRPEVGSGGGLLSFFHDTSGRMGGVSGAEMACVVVLTAPGVPLVRRHFPQDLDEYSRYREVEVVAEPETMRVPYAAWEVESLGLPHEQWLAWWAEFEEEDNSREPRHRMFGYPEPVQNEPRHWSDEVLLLQVDADDDAGMEWGDVGRIFYLIRPHDLTASRLDRVRLVFQCH